MLERFEAVALDQLFTRAWTLREQGHGHTISYSRKAFIPVCRKPHMGISESRGKKPLVHELRLRCLFRYARSKPDSVIWLFLARSTSHPVAAQSDCTNIPLAAGGAQEDETILNCGFSGHGFRRFVHLDPPGLMVLED